MIATFLSYNVFKGKDGREWAKVYFYNEKGNTEELFMSYEDFNAFNFSRFFLDKEKASHVNKNYLQGNISFNSRGRLDSLSPIS